MKQKVKVLIADDNPKIRSTLKDILSEKGYAACAFKNGYELLANLKNELPEIIILDMVMPEKNGIDILSTIKSVLPEAKVIIYTGFKKYQNSIYASMADRFLLKADNPENLLQCVAELAKE